MSKCEGLYIFYKLWIAAKILDITKDEMKLLVKDRIHPVGDIVYRCFSLAFNCKYISFTRAGLNLGRHSCSVNASAIIAATDPNKCDAPLLDWCLLRRASQEVRPGTRSPTFGRRVPSTHQQDVHCGPTYVMQMWIVIAYAVWCGPHRSMSSCTQNSLRCRLQHDVG